jgi:ATP-dependent DNA helicase RecG
VRAFAAADDLTRDELLAAPVRWPRPEAWDAELDVPGTKKAQAAAELLGLTTFGALLEHLPRARQTARTVAALVQGETASVVVEVRSIRSRPVRRRGMRPLVEATVADETGLMGATFFNQPWLEKKYRPGTRLALTGKYEGRNRFRVQQHAPTNEAAGTSDDVAVYAATDGITSTQILALVQEHLQTAFDTIEPLPGRLRAAQRLADRAGALLAAHAGEDGGRERLAFEELLLDQIVQLRLRDETRGSLEATPLAQAPTLSARWRADELPFAMTDDQIKAVAEIDADLAKARPMQRLLMGEVGSGKTVVALHAMLRAVEHGAQAALMAPTETLAEQHFATLQALMPGSFVPAALLTGSTSAARRRETLARLATGELPLIVGTHALIEDAVEFHDLAVVVVDEQHRFGVQQRRALDAKAGRAGSNLAPHVLHMTATPIPRTLRLASFGALDVTTLKQLPKGRQPIETHLADGERARARAYERIREELRAGRQAFIVCPLVEESELLQARAATAEYERLKATEFAGFDVVLLHGQMKSREKAAAMEAFAAGGADVLVATTVIEVGIDVPNATVMLVEDAERYGISQLHQLRGRVGRGQHPSLCLLFGPAESARLKALAEHGDGFRLAEIDLELRGEGELTGTRQSGLARFRFAQLPDDAELLERAHGAALDVLAADPGLAAPEHALLAQQLALAEAQPVAA